MGDNILSDFDLLESGDTASVSAAVVPDYEVSATVGSPVIGEPVESIDPLSITGLERACLAVTNITTELEQIDADYARAYAEMMNSVDPVLRQRVNDLTNRRSSLTAQREPHDSVIRAAVLKLGKTFKMGRVTAVWSEGRESADIQMIKGMAAIYPGIARALKKGEPSVSIRVK